MQNIRCMHISNSTFFIFPCKIQNDTMLWSAFYFWALTPSLKKKIALPQNRWDARWVDSLKWYLAHTEPPFQISCFYQKMQNCMFSLLVCTWSVCTTVLLLMYIEGTLKGRVKRLLRLNSTKIWFYLLSQTSMLTLTESPEAATRFQII